MKARRQFLALLTSASLFFLVSGCICVSMFRPGTPVLHKPSPCDLSPVLTIPLPENIISLAGIPRTETIVEDGYNRLIERQEVGRLDARRELFYLRKGGTAEVGLTEYMFVLFHTDVAAISEYEWAKKDHPVFREATENGLTGRVHYTEEPRADGEGGRGPMGYYISRADFRLHNLYIRVETKARKDQGEKPQNGKLANTVTELAQMLSLSLVTTNQTSK